MVEKHGIDLSETQAIDGALITTGDIRMGLLMAI
jgi:hypothetical protein